MSKVLFMCPHSAGKSLAAATYFRDAADKAGVEVEIAVAGPEPDDVNMPTVVEALTAQGHEIQWEPRLISTADTADADLLVSIGCDHGTIPTDREIIEWEVPLISVDLDGSLQAIHEHCYELIEQMRSSH